MSVRVGGSKQRLGYVAVSGDVKITNTTLGKAVIGN